MSVWEQRVASVETSNRALTSRVASMESMLASILAHHETQRLARHAAQMRRRRVRIGVAWLTVALVVATVVVLLVLSSYGT